ncbi:uncharacterized protein CEXT_261071 [Caerostris extrusa]|uniref:Uncharacterized protein n=1 Tax=Caerostris extrusa TaxID=172846 RepID=A0AAV4RXF6_CAEEX|nr:uncharacterized protein CEXT_261071 [Caerostris extrusa]
MPTSQHSNSASNWNSELQHFKYKLPRLFLAFLRWAGFVEESDRNCKKQIDLDPLLCSSTVSVCYPNCVFEALFNSVVHFICVTAVFWSAGSVPVALNKFNRCFYKKAHSRLLLLRTSEGRKLKRELFDKPEFALTGWDVIVYRRSSILAFVGTLLTYSIITMDIKFKK